MTSYVNKWRSESINEWVANGRYSKAGILSVAHNTHSSQVFCPPLLAIPPPAPGPGLLGCHSPLGILGDPLSRANCSPAQVRMVKEAFYILLWEPLESLVSNRLRSQGWKQSAESCFSERRQCCPLPMSSLGYLPTTRLPSTGQKRQKCTHSRIHSPTNMPQATGHLLSPE